MYASDVARKDTVNILARHQNQSSQALLANERLQKTWKMKKKKRTPKEKIRRRTDYGFRKNDSQYEEKWPKKKGTVFEVENDEDMEDA